MTTSTHQPAGDETSQIRLKQAVEFHQKGNLPQAEAIYLEILGRRPDHPDALHLLGVLAAQTGDHERAVALIGQAIRSDPGNANYRNTLGNSLRALRRLSEALAAYEQALAIKAEFPDACYNRGVALQDLGRYDDAIASYDRAIALRPGYVEALYNRGNALRATGQYEAAVASYDQAIAVRPVHAEFFQNRGNALRSLGRLPEAIASYDQAIALRPDYANAFYNRGSALREQGRADDALASYERAIALNSGFAEAYCERGAVLEEAGRFDEALASLAQAITLRPDYPEAYVNRGVVEQSLRQLRAARASYERAIALRPGYVEAWLNRGVTLQELGEVEAALASYDRAIELRPDFAEAHNNRGAALRELKRFDDAVASHDRAIELRPGYAEAHNSRGIALQLLLRLEEALASHNRSAALKPDYAEAWYDRGVALQLLVRIEDAIQSYDCAIALDPDYQAAYFNKSMALLLLGDFERGWPLYEHRWQCKFFTAPRSDFPQPLWLGREALAGRTILLTCEQGFGDTIQFCRFARQVAALGARVVLMVPPALAGLLEGLDGVGRILAKGDSLPPFDFHCPLLSLPLALGTRLDSIPAAPAYLKADPARVLAWAARLGAPDRPRIGLVWSGSTGHVLDAYRSMALSHLLPYLPPGYRYVCLQKELREVDREALQEHGEISYFADELVDFADTAALCMQMDLILSVDTSVAHLAGALGRPTWVMLPPHPDWRWLLGRNDSPWYPSVRLYRQSSVGDWSAVFKSVRADLLSFFDEDPFRK